MESAVGFGWLEGGLRKRYDNGKRWCLKAYVVDFPCVDSTRVEVAVLNTVLTANNEPSS